MKCDSPDCKTLATQILSVGALGRVVNLCPLHTTIATGPLDAALTPYQLTGLEHSFTKEQSLAQQVDKLDDEADDLHNQLRDARAENAHLQALLVSRLEQRNADLRSELEALKSANTSAPLTPREGVGSGG